MKRIARIATIFSLAFSGTFFLVKGLSWILATTVNYWWIW